MSANYKLVLECPLCNGTGKVSSNLICSECHGVKFIFRSDIRDHDEIEIIRKILAFKDQEL
jgi:DnaJ-class molecular chaperone